MKALLAQIRIETYMTFRRGETLLLTIGIPVAFLVFFSTVHVIGTGTAHSIDFYLPGILGLAVMSTSMVSLGIATGFERSYGVLRRLKATPLGSSRLLLAKMATILIVEVVQGVVLVGVGLLCGWENHYHVALALLIAKALGICLLGSAACSGIGLYLAGRLRAEVNLAAANGLYIVFLLFGGMVIPLAKFPHALSEVARSLPGGAIASGLIGAFHHGVSGGDWIVLCLWAVAMPALAAKTFRFE